MDTQRILHANLDDLVFEGRNKAYGAYELRRDYSKHILWALLIGVGLYVTAFTVPIILDQFRSAGDDTGAKELLLTELTAPPSLDEEVKPPPPPELPPPPAKTVVFTPPVIEEDEDVKIDETPPITEELVKADPNANTGVDPNYTPDFGGAGNNPVVTEEDPNKIWESVEIQAQFPGGQEEMRNFIMKNLRYPPQAVENRITGKVYVSFVVDVEGHISDIKLVRDIGGGCGQEALRVVKMMPDWKPGRQNGRPVKSRYSMPIVFDLGEE